MKCVRLEFVSTARRTHLSKMVITNYNIRTTCTNSNQFIMKRIIFVWCNKYFYAHIRTVRCELRTVKRSAIIMLNRISRTNGCTILNNDRMSLNYFKRCCCCCFCSRCCRSEGYANDKRFVYTNTSRTKCALKNKCPRHTGI